MSDASWWQGFAASTPPASYPIAPRCSQYLLLKDGTRLAADLFLPSGIGEERVPTVISLTPYVRGMDFRFRFAERLLAWLGLEQEEWGRRSRNTVTHSWPWRFAVQGRRSEPKRPFSTIKLHRMVARCWTGSSLNPGLTVRLERLVFLPWD